MTEMTEMNRIANVLTSFIRNQKEMNEEFNDSINSMKTNLNDLKSVVYGSIGGAGIYAFITLIYSVWGQI